MQGVVVCYGRKWPKVLAWAHITKDLCGLLLGLVWPSDAHAQKWLVSYKLTFVYTESLVITSICTTRKTNYFRRWNGSKFSLPVWLWSKRNYFQVWKAWFVSGLKSIVSAMFSHLWITSVKNTFPTLSLLCLFWSWWLSFHLYFLSSIQCVGFNEFWTSLKFSVNTLICLFTVIKVTTRTGQMELVTVDAFL